MDKDFLQGKIFISKDLNLYYYYFNEEKDEIDCNSLGFLEVMDYLGEPIVLEKGFTLRNYFELIDYYQAFQMLDIFFKCFIEEFKNCPKEGCRDSEIDYIVINKQITYESADSIKPTGEFEELDDLLTSDDGLIHIDKSINDIIEFHGYKKSNNQFYALDMSPLSELLDYEIVIGNIQLFIDNDYKYSAEENDMILFNFIKSIIWELSFYGCQEGRDLKRTELDEIVKDLDK